MSSCSLEIYLCLEYVPPQMICIYYCQLPGALLFQHHFDPNFWLGVFSATHAYGSVFSGNIFSFYFFHSIKSQRGQCKKDFLQSLSVRAGVILVHSLKGFILIWCLQSDYTQSWFPGFVCCLLHVWEPLKFRYNQGECWHRQSLFLQIRIFFIISGLWTFTLFLASLAIHYLFL